MQSVEGFDQATGRRFADYGIWHYLAAQLAGDRLGQPPQSYFSRYAGPRNLVKRGQAGVKRGS
jgi:hypothetical protein